MLDVERWTFLSSVLRERKRPTSNVQRSSVFDFQYALPELCTVNRIAGIETEYGCLVTGGGAHTESWPARVKNHLFKKLHVGVLDQHYRDYEEPPGNGGFLLNGGRFYLDMGHLEYATPECRSVRQARIRDKANIITRTIAQGDVLCPNRVERPLRNLPIRRRSLHRLLQAIDQQSVRAPQ